MATRKRLAVFAVAAGLLMSVPLVAHHGSAAFDVGKRVTLKGTVKEWAYLNPHCLLTLVVTGDDGRVVQWVAETQAPNVIFPAGYRKDSFKPGDQVTIIVEPVKNGRPIGRILQAVLANGKTLGIVPAGTAPSDNGAAQQR
jgi:Family of unknown function (DUF6152)